MLPSRNHCCYGSTKILSFCIVAELHVLFYNIEPLIVAMETKDLVPFALLSSCKTFLTAVNNINIVRSPCTVSYIVFTF